MNMISTPAELTPTVLNKAIVRYYKELRDYAGQADHELALRPAFQNLLSEMARKINLTLVHEMTIRGRIRPDGVLCDAFHIQRGYWEAKGPRGNLEEEIRQKIKDGYPLENALFENTRQAVLYQAGQRYDFDLHVQADAIALIRRFLTYQKPDIVNFEQAVIEFQGQIPNIAKRLLELINEEYQRNRAFLTAFGSFTELCRTTLNPKITSDEIKEMLVQHLLTERLFRTVFNNPDFVRNNVIAAEIEKVIAALTSRTFNRNEFLRSLDPFYGAIEGAAKGIETWGERQSFLNTVYERFFQGFAVQKADTLGIVYTPQEIVDFMVASVDEVLQREFSQSQGLATPSVKILDPCVGTGNFIVNVIKRIPRTALREKYTHDLFCNEIALLPYYIASLNIEREYYEKMKEYFPFEGICFVDTLELAESQQLPLWIVEENTERIRREKDADIMVVIGNPPYNVGQRDANENNKNRKYSVVDGRIGDTYVKASNATLRTKLYDAYVRFFRWASDRLQNREGIVCFISNNSFVDQMAFDGMRKHLLRDFTQVYHLDLHGNVRKNPKLSGSTHNVFGIQVGVGITIAIRSFKDMDHKIYYYRVPELWRKTEKLTFLSTLETMQEIPWQNLQPDEKSNWITERFRSEFNTFLSLGTKESKQSRITGIHSVLFKTYSLGVNTARDGVAYDFNAQVLSEKVLKFTEDYNSEISRWVRSGQPKDIDNFLQYDKVKWSRNIKRDLVNQRYISFSKQNIRKAVYRPFTNKWLYASDIVVDELGTNLTHFAHDAAHIENIAIALTNPGSEKPFMVLATNYIADLHLVGAGSGSQCFPYYIYAEDGSNRKENITDWALEQFQARYGAGVSKLDIFHYIYAILHHPQYREYYAENLKRDLPHIPLLVSVNAYQTAVRIGHELMNLHIDYEQQEPYPLTPQEDPSVPFGQLHIVEKMKLTPDRSAVIVNKGLALAGIPEACFRYRLGNRSALEWVIDQYQISKDSRSGIVSDPNRADDPEYIVRLVKQVVTVSVKTVALVDELTQAVTQEDWLDERVGNAK